MLMLNKVSLILFNILAFLFGVTFLGNIILTDMEVLITDNFFGGYEWELVNTDGGNEDTYYFKSDFASVDQLRTVGKNVTIAASSEGSVLLKNDNNALPLAKGDKVSLFSVSSVQEPLYSTAGGAARFVVLPNEKLYYKDVFEEAGLEVNPALYEWYASHTEYHHVMASGNSQKSTINDAKWDEITTDAKVDATYGDSAIFIISRVGTEGIDLEWTGGGEGDDYTDGDYLNLSPSEMDTLKNLKLQKEAGVFKSIVIIINSANPLNANFLEDEQYGIDAALWIGHPGAAGLYGVADILVGNVNPSGRLPDTWFGDHCYNPSMANYGAFKHEYNYVVYQEGIYVGYRYTETRYEDLVLGTANVGNYDYEHEVTYPFGYGLSYTEFEYSNMTLLPFDPGSDNLKISVTVTNKGTVAGKEVVQVYLQQPYTQYDIDNHIQKASAELVGFAKTSKLAPGASETVTIEVGGRMFASYDAYGHGTWFVDAGTHYLTVAKNSHDAVNNILAAKKAAGVDVDTYKMTACPGDSASGNADLVMSFEREADATTYKYASRTGAEVVNLFDESDLNRLNDGVNSVEYLNRSNWEGTLLISWDEDGNYTDNHTVVYVSDKIKEGHSTDCNGAVKPDDIAYPTMGADNGLNLIDLRADADGNPLPYDHELWEKLLDQLTWDDYVTLFDNGSRRTGALPSINKPATIDHNGSCGFYSKFSIGPTGLATLNNDPDANQYCTAFPSPGIIAATFNVKIAETVGQIIGEESLWSGQTGIYGLGFNLHRNAYHGRLGESYSECGFLTGMIGGYQTRGVQSKGAYVYNKHLVLNEQEKNRLGHETWISEQALRQLYLLPFEMGVEIGDGMNVMTAFTRLGSKWSGNCENLCEDWLRGETAMRGFAITDSYLRSYMGIAGGIMCGVALPDGSNGKASFEGKATGYGALAWQMREEAHRVLYTVVQSNAMNGIGANTKIITYEPEWVTLKNNVVQGVSIAFYISAGLAAVTSVFAFIKRKRG